MDFQHNKIVEDLFVGVTVFDITSHDCLFANSAALEILETQDLSFKLASLFVDEIDGQKTFDASHLLTLGNSTDILMRKPNGTIFVANLGIKKVDPNILVISFDDITVHKKLQRELETKQIELRKNAEDLLKQNQQLVELDKAKDKFFALTSHELRTPLSSIIATAQFMIDDGLCEDNEEALSYINVIFSEGKHLLEIINDILDFSKIQAGKLELYLEKKNISKLLRERMEYIEKFAKTRSIKMSFENQSEDRSAYFDEIRLAQVFDNILSNAIKYNKDGGDISIKFESSQEAPFIKISFADSGIGIPDEFQSKIFNEFETIENVRHHQQGTGLGMPICKNLVTLMGGKIYFESKAGQGTTFFIEIPTQKVLPLELYRSRPLSTREVA